MSQQELAAQMGVSASYLSGVEHGTRAPLTGAKACAFARILCLTRAEVAELAEAREQSQLRFQLSGAALNPLQVQLANRFHQKLAGLTPAQIERIGRELSFVPEGQRPATQSVSDSNRATSKP